MSDQWVRAPGGRRRGGLRPYWLMCALGAKASPKWFAINLTLSVLNGAPYPLLALLLADLTDGIVHHHGRQLVTGIIVWAFILMATYVTHNMASFTRGPLTQRVDLYLAEQTGELVNGQPGLEHLERPEYLAELDTLNLLRRQLSAAPGSVANMTYLAGRVIISVVLLALLNPAFLVVPVLALAPYLAGLYSTRQLRAANDAVAGQVRQANFLFSQAATAGPAKELHVYGVGPELHRRHVALEASITAAHDRAGYRAMLVGLAGWMVFALGFVGALVLGVLQAAQGHLGPGAFVEMVILVQQVEVQVSGITGNIAGIQQARQAAERYLNLVDLSTETERIVGRNAPPARIEQGIRLDGVSFRYPGTGTDVLRDINLDLPAGASVAIVGENGSGKTTLAKLLAAMYQPTEGTISIDGKDLAGVDPETWRAKITATFQDFYNFELRAGHTVGLGDLPRMDDDHAVHGALRAVGGARVLDDLEQGLDTLLGPSNTGGTNLSGGQWQTLALGRSRMRDRPLLLLLDEPTASLDAATEYALFEHYRRASREAAAAAGGITLFVSHRFSTVRMADLIVVLAHGQVVGAGSHRELLAAGGLYAELFELQERSYKP